jgi:hypothetical protein
MSSIKRARGRPAGSGYNDTPTLEEIADLMVAQPSLKATTAMRRILGRPGTSEIRRLQVKWKAGSAEYLVRARARRAAAQAPVRRVSAPYSPRIAHQLMEAQRKMHDAIGPAIRAAQELMNSPRVLAIQEAARRFHESPAVRAIEEYRNSPTARAMEEFQNSPTMRTMREFQDSPTMRAMRELQDSPTMRAAQEAAQEIAKIHRLISGSGF